MDRFGHHGSARMLEEFPVPAAITRFVLLALDHTIDSSYAVTDLPSLTEIK
jgi:hypothetical protein